MNPEKVLEKIGFSPNEIKVYLTLNEKGSIPAGKISKLSKIDRSSCYNSLKLLQEKGFVSYVVISNIKYFQSTGPKRIVEFLKEQEDDAKAIVPMLEEKRKVKTSEGQVRLFKGEKGIRSIFLDMIREGKDNFAFGSEGQFSERMPEFAVQFDRMKREKKMKTKLIIRKDRTELDDSTTTYRYLPSLSESPAVTNIYGDKIAILIWTDEPEGIIIENPSAAKAYKAYFDILWNSAKGLK